jgi:hypothetical protein
LHSANSAPECHPPHRRLTAAVVIATAVSAAAVSAQDGSDYRGFAATALVALAGLAILGIADLFLLAYIFLPLPGPAARKLYFWAAGVVLAANLSLLVVGWWPTIMFLWTSRSGLNALGLESAVGRIMAFVPFASTVLAASAPLIRKRVARRWL